MNTAAPLILARLRRVVRVRVACGLAAAAMVLALAPVTATAGSDPGGDCDDAARDIVSVAATQDQGDVVITVTTAQPFDFATTLVFFDADGNPETGYRPAGDTAQGFDLLASGGSLSRHHGDDPSAWRWESVVATELTVAGHVLTLRFKASLLGGTSPGYAVWNMSPDWQTPMDLAPDEGVYPLGLAPPVLEPGVEEPQIIVAPRKANADLPPRERVAQSTSFYCYYGSGKVAELSHYDVAILHSPQMTAEDIAKLKHLGVVTVGYITVGEDDQKRVGDGTGPAGLASWYFDRNDDQQPDQNSIWNSWYANANDPGWRADRVKEAKRLIEEEGYDGLFLDTLDTAQIYPDSADGMVQLVADLRQALPASPIVLNQGFDLFHRLAPMVDGLMLESFTATYNFDAKDYVMHPPASLDANTRIVNGTLQPTLETYPMPIFVLDYARPDDHETIQTAADRAVSFGYQYATAPIMLDAVYVNGIVGEPDPGWLEMQASLESMSIHVTQPINGFPIGTVITPSSCFAGYTAAPLVDGINDRSALSWSDASWASSDHGGEYTWVQVTLPAPADGGEFVITWATDAGTTHVSQNYHVQTRTRDGEWQDAGPAIHTTETTHAHRLPDEPYTQIRVRQPDGGGGTARPGLMWLAQLQIVAR
ncbi:MAG: endo alpha-1,4 polygalactosaminidase [Planctomycetota bacterium]